ALDAADQNVVAGLHVGDRAGPAGSLPRARGVAPANLGGRGDGAGQAVAVRGFDRDGCRADRTDGAVYRVMGHVRGAVLADPLGVLEPTERTTEPESTAGVTRLWRGARSAAGAGARVTGGSAPRRVGAGRSSDSRRSAADEDGTGTRGNCDLVPHWTRLLLCRSYLASPTVRPRCQRAERTTSRFG